MPKPTSLRRRGESRTVRALVCDGVANLTALNPSLPPRCGSWIVTRQCRIDLAHFRISQSRQFALARHHKISEDSIGSRREQLRQSALSVKLTSRRSAP